MDELKLLFLFFHREKLILYKNRVGLIVILNDCILHRDLKNELKFEFEVEFFHELVCMQILYVIMVLIIDEMEQIVYNHMK